MKNFVVAIFLAVLVVLASASLRRAVAGIGGAPVPMPRAKMSIGGAPVPMPKALGIGGVPVPMPR